MGGLKTYLDAGLPVSCFCRCFLIVSKSGLWSEESISSWTTGIVASALNCFLRWSLIVSKFMLDTLAVAATEITKVVIAKIIFFMDTLIDCY